MPEVQTPLWELLADVPKDLRIGVETPNPLGSDVQWIPVGQLCAQASEELAQAARATDRGPVAWLPPDPPPECKSEAEKTAFAFGWFKALESRRTAREEAIYETIIQWDEGGGKRSRRELARRIVALYATTGDKP